MRRPAVKLLPALLLPGLLASCLLPPFDRGLSLAEATARKLKLEARIGPLYRYRGELERGRCYFLPGKTLGLNRGFLVVFGATEGRLFYVAYDSAGGYSLTGDHVFLVKNSNENLFNYGAFVLKDSSGADDDALLLVRPDVSPNPRMEYYYNSVSGVFSEVPYTDLSTFTTGQVVGVGLFPDVSATTDFLTILVNEAGYKDRFSSYAFLSSDYTLSPGWTPSAVLAPAIPGSPLQGFYFRNPISGVSFLSVWSGSQYMNYRWYDALTLTTLPFSSRIEALLSTNELFVVDGDQGIVYSPAGERKYRFPLGDLHFAYETYIGSVPTLLFSLIYWDQVSGNNEEFHINVYSLPTASLSTLD